ncbi:MAG: NUDIX domain-containing protein [Candidatus Bipolaricaulota bacterium]
MLVFRSLDEPKGFDVPKGAARPDETFEEAARRELLEESGVEAARPLGEIGTAWFGDERQAPLSLRRTGRAARQVPSHRHRRRPRCWRPLRLRVPADR